MGAQKRDKSVVSYTMSRIRSKDTSIEVRLRRELWRRGMRYRTHYKKAPGSPDIAFPSAKVAVFCDSTFWHGRDWKKRKARMQTNRDYWVKKIEGNIARDRRVDSQLAAAGWRVLRFWDVDIERDLDWCAREVEQMLSVRKRKP